MRCTVFRHSKEGWIGVNGRENNDITKIFQLTGTWRWGWIWMNERGELDLKVIRIALEEERSTLAEASASTTEDRAPVELDQQSVGRLSRMDAIQVQAMAVANETRRQERLQMIQAALRRLDDGEYGYCLACDEDIPAKRLAIDPAVTRCVDCAGRAG